MVRGVRAKSQMRSRLRMMTLLASTVLSSNENVGVAKPGTVEESLKPSMTVEPEIGEESCPIAHNGCKKDAPLPLGDALIAEHRPLAVPRMAIIERCKAILEKAEADRTEREKLALRRLGKAKIEEMVETQKNGQKFFNNMVRVKNLKDVRDDENTLTVRVYNKEEGTYYQKMHFDPDDLRVIRNWLMSIPDEHIREKFPGTQGEQMVAEKLLSPNDYVRNALCQIANTNDTIRQWLFRSADEHHPLWQHDTRGEDENDSAEGINANSRKIAETGWIINRKLLPKGWTTIYFKGSGEAPILEEDVHLSPRLQDAYFWRKMDRAHPLDRREFGKEYDIRRNPNGWFFDYIARRLNAVRPTDSDRDYFFDLESEVPFTDCKTWDAEREALDRAHSMFTVKNPTIGRILGNVPSQKHGLIPLLSKQQIVDLAFRAKVVKTFAEGGDYQDTTKKAGSIPSDAETAA